MAPQNIKQTVIVKIDTDKKKKKKKKSKRKAKPDGLRPGTATSAGRVPAMFEYRSFQPVHPVSQFDNIAKSINERLQNLDRLNIMTAYQQEAVKPIEPPTKDEGFTSKQMEQLQTGANQFYGLLKSKSEPTIEKHLEDKVRREYIQLPMAPPPIESPFYEVYSNDPKPEPKAAAEPEPEPEEGTVEQTFEESSALENQSKDVTNQILNANSSDAFEYPDDDEIMMPISFGQTSVIDAVDDEYDGPRGPKISNLRKAITNSVSNAKGKEAKIIAKYRKKVFEDYVKSKKI